MIKMPDKNCKICKGTGWNYGVQCKPSKAHPTGWKTERCECVSGTSELLNAEDAMGEKQSSTPPPMIDKSKPPSGSPGRVFRFGLFGEQETKESVRQREDYETYMRGWRDGFGARKNI